MDGRDGPASLLPLVLEEPDQQAASRRGRRADDRTEVGTGLFRWASFASTMSSPSRNGIVAGVPFGRTSRSTRKGCPNETVLVVFRAKRARARQTASSGEPGSRVSASSLAAWRSSIVQAKKSSCSGSNHVPPAPRTRFEHPPTAWDNPKCVYNVDTVHRRSQACRHEVGEREPDRHLRVERRHLDDEPAMGCIVNIAHVDPARQEHTARSDQHERRAEPMPRLGVEANVFQRASASRLNRSCTSSSGRVTSHDRASIRSDRPCAAALIPKADWMSPRTAQMGDPQQAPLAPTAESAGRRGMKR